MNPYARSANRGNISAMGKKVQDEGLAQLEEVKIYSIQFAMMSDEEMRRLSATPGGIAHSSNPPVGPNYNGINDKRMGGSPQCGTCNRGEWDCAGHMGHIELPFKIYAPKMMPVIIDLMRIVCHKCYHIRIDPRRLIEMGKINATMAANYCEYEAAEEEVESDNEDLATELNQVAGGNFIREDELGDNTGSDGTGDNAGGPVETKESATMSSGRLHSIALYIEKSTRGGPGKYLRCHRCDNSDPPVSSKDSNTHRRVILKTQTGNKAMPISAEKTYPEKTSVELIFANIPEGEKKLLGFPDRDGPLRFIKQTIPVVPPRLRPPPEINGVWQNHHLTTIYMNMLITLDAIDSAGYSRAVMNFEEPSADFAKSYGKLMSLLNGLMDNSQNEISLQGPREIQITTLSQMLTGKMKLFRGAIAGKRVDFTARLPITHEEGIEFNEIGVPEFVCDDVPMRKRVTSENREDLQALLRARKIRYWAPSGALPGTIKVCSAKFQDTYDLQIGEFVWRPLRNGDFILAGRQPTIHKTSIMGYRVRVMKGGRTLVISLPITMLHNADLDGDEMTIHVPQTEEAQKAVFLMSPENYIMDEETNKPGVAPTFNALTAARHLTMRTEVVSEELYALIMKYLRGKQRSQVSLEGKLEERLAEFGIHPRSGAGIFSALLPMPGIQGPPGGPSIASILSYPVYYRKGKVIVMKSVLVQGIIGKDHIGRAEKSLVQQIHKDYGPSVAGDFINDVTAVMSIYIDNVGLSTSLAHCVPTGESKSVIAKKINENVEAVKLKIAEIQGRPGPLTPQEAKRREIEIADHLNIVSQIGDDITEEILSRDPKNPFLTIIQSGAKGEMTHVAQVGGLGGQAYFNGQRLQPQGGRIGPYYRKGDLCEEAKGFCRSNFGGGMSLKDYFSHITASREQIMDTGVKTAETGYLQRRISSQMAGLYIAEDGTVRDESGRIFQYIYGDGFRGSELMQAEIGGRTVLSPIDPDHIVEVLNAHYEHLYT